MSIFDDWTNFVNDADMSESKKDRVLTTAREVFLRYGYNRVSMADLAGAAGISRPALYLIFKNKEEIFSGVFLKWVNEKIAEMEKGMAALATPRKKLEHAFEIWTVRPFDIVIKSPEGKELLECTFGFAQATQRQGYAMFEAAIVPVLASMIDNSPENQNIDPARIAHVLASAALGFKQTAANQTELRRLIKELLTLSLHRFS